MEWLEELWHKLLPYYYETEDFKNKLSGLKNGSVVWLELAACPNSRTLFVIKDVLYDSFVGDALILPTYGGFSPVRKSGVEIKFKKIVYLTEMDINLAEHYKKLVIIN